VAIASELTGSLGPGDHSLPDKSGGDYHGGRFFNSILTILSFLWNPGRTLDDLDFYELMEEFFMATTLIRQADARVARGLAPPDTRMGHDNTVTQMLARRLRLPVPDLSPDYIAHRGGKVH